MAFLGCIPEVLSDSFIGVVRNFIFSMLGKIATTQRKRNTSTHNKKKGKQIMKRAQNIIMKTNKPYFI